MIKKICSIRDRLTGHLSVFLEDNEKVAMRNFTRAIMHAGPTVDKGDIELILHGDFDTELGTFDIKPSALLMTGNEVKTNVEDTI